MKLDFDGLRKKTAGAFNAVVKQAENAQEYEGRILIDPEKLSDNLEWLRDCLVTLLCVETGEYKSIIDSVPLLSYEPEIEN